MILADRIIIALTGHLRCAPQLGHCHRQQESGAAVLEHWLLWYLGEHRADKCMILEDTTGRYNRLDWGTLH
jgi:hypothetical protein